MQAPDLPNDETVRLMTLKSLNILDTPSEDRFDRLARLTMKMFNVPVAMVTLVDEERQWMKSCVGMDPQILPRAISFCGHAILGSEVFVIPDMLLDERFADNPLVLEQNVRFYAGCPIKSSNGSKLGTLCIVDTVPREFTTDECNTLADLAAMVELEIAALELATHDPLTGLLNRRGFTFLAENALNLCIRNKLPACFAFIDLNKFKSINDEFGHQEGDKVLEVFSNFLTESIRDSDIVARNGGDEFVIMFMDTNLEQAQLVLDKINNKLSVHKKELDIPYQIEYSAGLVKFNSEKHNGIEDLLHESDALMYQNK